jgi:hypothetical protein
MSRPRPSWAAALVSLAAALLAGCAHTVVASQAVVDMDRVRVAPAVTEGAALAPQQYQHAEDERREALLANEQGDRESADLHAERAHVAYERAVALARLARATTEGEAARLALAKEIDEAQRLAATRAPFEMAADVASTELAVAREALVPAHIGPADGARERARLVAARSLGAEGHLLCGAAHLLAELAVAGGQPGGQPVDPARLDAATHGIQAFEASLGKAGSGAARLETAAKARAACLDALTHMRRAAGEARQGAGDADALLSALSAHGGWDPLRDERGVVVTLRGAFKGTTLVPEADRELQELGRVAAAHPGNPIQVVVHDATAPSAGEKAADEARGRVALSALHPAAPSRVETIGESLPVTDPSDARNRGRNARLEVVFVSGTD